MLNLENINPLYLALTGETLIIGFVIFMGFRELKETSKQRK